MFSHTNVVNKLKIKLFKMMNTQPPERWRRLD